MTVILISLLLAAAILAIAGWVRVLRRDDFDGKVRELSRLDADRYGVPLLSHPWSHRWNHAQLRFVDDPERGLQDAMAVIASIGTPAEQDFAAPKMQNVHHALSRFSAGRANRRDLQHAMVICRELYDELSERSMRQTA